MFLKKIYSFDTTSEAINILGELVEQDDAILVKASRFMKFEVISEFLTK